MRPFTALLVALTLLPACGASQESKSAGSKDGATAEAPTKGEAGEAEAKAVRPKDEPDNSVVAALPRENLAELEVAEPGQAYGQVMIKTRSTDNHLAELTVVRAKGVKPHAGAVRYTAEPRVVVAKAQTKLDESNLLGTGIAIDIDGDGKTASTIASTCEADTAVLQTKDPVRFEPVTVLTEAVARFDYGPDDARIMSNGKVGALMYAPCDSGNIVLGLDPAAPLEIHSVPSPAVFVVYRAPVDSIDAEDPFTLEKIAAGEDAVKHQRYSFREVNVEGDEVKVFAAHLVVFGLDAAPPLQHLAVEISGAKPEFITASINEVDADGKRIRYGDGFKPF